MYSCTLSLTSVLDGWWVVNATPLPLYPKERPSTHFIGGWVGPRPGPDGCVKSRPLTGIRSPDEIDVEEDIINEYNIRYLGRFPYIIVTQYYLINVSIPSAPSSDIKHFTASAAS
jgi:hypothetical protein